MMKRLLLLLVVVAVMHPVSAQTTLTLQCSQDVAIGYDDGVYPSTAGNNYGAAIQNAAFCVPGIDPNGFNVNRALIDFNLSGLPANAVIISAKLNLYALGPFGSLPGHTGTANASTLQRITQSWQEYTATWNNQPNSTTQNQVTLNQSTSPTQDYLNTDVTALVQDMLNNPAASFGFKLQLLNQAASNALAFASKDHANAALHPNLVITYRIACAAPLVVSVSASPSHICNGGSSILTASGGTTYLWSTGQQTLGTSASISVSPITITQYSVTASDPTTACSGSATVTITVDNCTGIKNESAENTLRIYPNPGAGDFTVISETEFSSISVTGLEGRLALNYQLPFAQTAWTLHDTGLKPGVYFCHLFNQDKPLGIKKLLVTN